MTALAGVELDSLVSEPDALTTRPPPYKLIKIRAVTHFHLIKNIITYCIQKLLKHSQQQVTFHISME